ncbi:hypothetical protein [Streptomyces sp. NBC_00986]|uniref:hypothetical protein n=1 Tax=Streptomyces sp. NBC_00986 TaxID=2903702 RepID=UPI003863B9AF|nr:hypothetical protein OG504_14320 [Streptomyces sp. NBC_00986]
MPPSRGAGALAARCTGIGAGEVFGVVGCAGAAGATDGNSADGTAEFGVGVDVGVDAIVDFVDFGAVEAAAAAPGEVAARCTLSVPLSETGAAPPGVPGRFSGSVALGPTGS